MPVSDTVTLTALNTLTTEEITVRVRNGARAATGGTVRVGSIEVLGELDYPFVEKVVKVNIGRARPVQLISRITGAPGSEFTVIVESGAPVSPAGGTVEVAGGDVKIAVPAGAVEGEIAIAAEEITTPEDPGNLGAYDFGPDGTTFEKPITLTFPVPTAALPAGGTPGLYWRQDLNDEWKPLDNPKFDAAAGTVSGDIAHFTQIGIRTRAIRVCPGDPNATATVAEGVAQVSRQGQVVLCDAEHTVDNVLIAKPLTVMSEPGTRARIVGPTTSMFVVDGVANGTVRFNRLSMAVTTPGAAGVQAKGTWDQLVVDSSTFTVVTPPLPALTAGILVTESSVNSAKLTAFGNSITGGWNGIRMRGTPFMDVRDNQIDETNGANIEFQAAEGARAVGEIARNRMHNCGQNGCIRLNNVDSVRVDSNQVTAVRRFYVGSTTEGGQYAFFVNGGKMVMRGNSIVGQNLPENLNNIFAFPFNDATVYVQSSPVLAGHLVANGNSIEGGTRAFVTSWPNLTLEPTASGRDNQINKVGIAFEARGGSRMSFINNDITNSVIGPAHAGLVAANRAPGLRIGDLSCNYWGAPTYQLGMSNSAVPHGVILPLAPAPVAGTSGSGCTPTPVPPASATRVCSTADITAAVPQFTNLWWAVASTANNGTITLCPGTYNSSNLNLTRPMTIQGEAGSSRPILDGRMNGAIGGAQAFLIGVTEPGTITIRNLEFIGSRFSAISINGDYDRVVIENNLFRPTNDPNPQQSNPGDVQGLGFFAGVGMGNTQRTVAGNGVVVRNNEFIGGDIGVNTFRNVDITIENNTFGGHRNAAVNVGGGGPNSIARISSNTITGCGVARCLGAFSGRIVTISGNSVSTPFSSRATHGIEVAADSAVVTNNVITGSGGSPVTNVGDSWPMLIGIKVNSGARSAFVSGNQVSGAFAGMRFDGGIIRGADNRISNVDQLFDIRTATTTMQRNDFAGFARMAFVTVTLPAQSFACNWWGSANGPSGGGLASNTLSPFSTVPIAGTSIACSP